MTDSQSSSKTLTAYGPPRIAATVDAMTSNSTTPGDSAYERRATAVEAVLDDAQSGSFSETMLYAHQLCETYDIGYDYHPEQRADAVYQNDWRTGILGGLWQLTEAAIKAEQTRRETTPESTATSATTPTEEYTYAPQDIKAYADDLVDQIRSHDPPENYPYNAIAQANKASQLLDDSTDFMTVLLVANHLTDQYNLGRWAGMTDTTVREDIAYGHFCECIRTTILPELIDALPAKIK